MQIVNWIKVGLIKLADFINTLFEPWDEYTRPIDRKPDDIHIAEKARQFEDILVSRFKALEGPDYVIWNYKNYNGAGATDIGDQCLHQGLTTYMWWLKCRLQPDESTQEWLDKSIQGLEFYQPAEGSLPTLYRGVNSYGYSQEDASSDALTGYILGLYVAWTRSRNTKMVTKLAHKVIANHDCLVNKEGKPTKFGKLVNGYLTDPLGLLNALALYKLAAVAGSFPASRHYERLIKEYGPLIPYGHVSLLGWRKDYDEHRAMILYMVLAMLETGEVAKLYRKGAERAWRKARRSRNPWLLHLYSRITGKKPDIEGCIDRFAEMTVVDKTNVVERTNVAYGNLRFFKYRGETVSRQPIPLWLQPSQDFQWMRNQYSVNGWPTVKEKLWEHNGVDYLLIYWGLLK